MKRPGRSAKEIRLKAAELLAPKVMDWLRQADDEMPLEDVIKDLAELGEDDGYQMARSLETNSGWNPDASLVEILEGFSPCISRARDQVVAEWVKTAGITLYAVGMPVRFKHRGSEVTGVIYEVQAAVARYGVRSKALGHIEPGSGMSGVLGIILDHEQVTAEAELVAETSIND